MPTPAELEWRLLDEANEDSCGLWEPCWALRTDLTLDLTDAELGAFIEPVMRDLVHRGLIELSAISGRGTNSFQSPWSKRMTFWPTR